MPSTSTRRAGLSSGTKRRFPISLVMIVRNEEAVLDRCLTSVAGLVDEIVIVDTGSTDRTVEIARNHGAKVHAFTWIDDFAAARNHGLDQATHPWRLILDADEWIVDRDRAGRELEAVGMGAPTFVGLVGITNVTAVDGSLPDDIPAPLARLLPSTVRYHGRIHEQPQSGLPKRQIALRIGHDGYTDAALAAKGDRNRLLLEQALTEEPHNPYLWYQLGSEHMAREQLEESATHLIQAYNLIRPLEGSAGEVLTYWLMIVVRLVRVLVLQKRFEEALAVCSQELDAWPTTSSFYVMFGIVAWEKAVHDLRSGGSESGATELCNLAISCWTRVLELGDDQSAFGAVPERPTVLATRGLIEIYSALGRHDDAEHYRRLAA